MGSGTHLSKFDGFPETYGTHANGASVQLDLDYGRVNYGFSLDLAPIKTSIFDLIPSLYFRFINPIERGRGTSGLSELWRHVRSELIYII